MAGAEKTAKIVVAIDGSRTRAGGGVAHLTNLLRCGDVIRRYCSHVAVCAPDTTLAALPDEPWLSKHLCGRANADFGRRVFWQQLAVYQWLNSVSPDIVLCPGGSSPLLTRHPLVTICQNMLPFDLKERSRYGMGRMRLRLGALHWVHRLSARRAAGVIFLTKYAREAIQQQIGRLSHTAIVPHGVDDRFLLSPRVQEPLSAYSMERPFKLLYVSIIDLYKHQWVVARAVRRLRKDGYPVRLTLTGPAYNPALRKLQAVLSSQSEDRDAVEYLGSAPYSDIQSIYHGADGFVFASTCENLPNIMLEAMAAGLPIACSNTTPMPEILGTAAEPFDAESEDSVYRSLSLLLSNHHLRQRMAQENYDRACKYTWPACAEGTFAFLSQVVGSLRKA